MVVGAEAVGRLVSFDVTEGQQLAADAVVGSIDSTDLTLERDELCGAARRQRVARERGRAPDRRARRPSATPPRRSATRPKRRKPSSKRSASRQARLRAHAPPLRPAGGDGAAARSGRARLSRSRTADQGPGRADRRPGSPGQRAHRQQIDATRAQRQTATEQVELHRRAESRA